MVDTNEFWVLTCLGPGRCPAHVKLLSVHPIAPWPEGLMPSILVSQKEACPTDGGPQSEGNTFTVATSKWTERPENCVTDINSTLQKLHYKIL